MKDSAKEKVRIGVSFLTIIAQAALLSIIAENKTQEFIIMLIAIVLLSEGRQQFQKLAVAREEELHGQREKETKTKKSSAGE